LANEAQKDTRSGPKKKVERGGGEVKKLKETEMGSRESGEQGKRTSLYQGGEVLRRNAFQLG